MRSPEARISIIAAMDSKRGIGKDNKLLFWIKEDFKRMNRIRGNHPLIMGRKTHESILEYTGGKVLSGGTNYVVTHDPNYSSRHNEGCVICNSLEEAIKRAKEEDNNEIIIFGGGKIYEQALPLTDRLYLTIVKGDFEADIFFPPFSDFKKVVFEEAHDSEGLKYKFLTLER